MPYKSGKLKGELTNAEIRRLIREHNKLYSIKVPPKTDRDGLIKLINDNGYAIDHKNQRLNLAMKKLTRKINLPPPPTPKTAEQKAEEKKKREKKKLESNLELKMKVEKVRSKVDDSVKKSKKEEPKKEPEKKKPEKKQTDRKLPKGFSVMKPKAIEDYIKEKKLKFGTKGQETKLNDILDQMKGNTSSYTNYWLGETLATKLDGNKISFIGDFKDVLGARGVENAILKDEKSVFTLKN